MSLLYIFLEVCHGGDEVVEQIGGIVRTGRCFGMVLHRKCRQRFVLNPLYSIVVEINVRHHGI